ncbi:MAG: hypothetical protein ACLFQ8_00520 [Candidatus Aenigmatarchaeota archaeon]
MLAELAEGLQLELTTYQIYAMLFLLGSLAVSSISDLKKTAAQKEFFHFWLIFSGVMAIVDFYPQFVEGSFPPLFLGKWILIGAFVLLSWRRTGFVFRLAKMDVSAVVAVSTLLSFTPLLAFYLLLKIFSLVLRSILSKGDRYPFLPIIFCTVTVIILANLYFI